VREVVVTGGRIRKERKSLIMFLVIMFHKVRIDGGLNSKLDLGYDLTVVNRTIILKL